MRTKEGGAFILYLAHVLVVYSRNYKRKCCHVTQRFNTNTFLKTSNAGKRSCSKFLHVSNNNSLMFCRRNWNLPEMHIEKSQGLWENVLWAEETKLELLGASSNSYRTTNETKEKNDSYCETCLILFWGCFS